MCFFKYLNLSEYHLCQKFYVVSLDSRGSLLELGITAVPAAGVIKWHFSRSLDLNVWSPSKGHEQNEYPGLKKIAPYTGGVPYRSFLPS